MFRSTLSLRRRCDLFSVYLWRGLSVADLEGREISLPNGETPRDALYLDFRVLKSEAEFKGVVERLAPRLSAQNLASAFARIHQLGARPDEPTQKLLTQRAFDVAASMSAREAVSVFRACSRVRCIETSLFEALAERLMTRECMLQLDGMLIAECVMSLAKLPRDLFRNQFELAQELARLCVTSGCIETIQTECLTRIISGFGMLRFHNAQFRQAISLELLKRERLKSMKFDELVRIYTALSRLQIKDEAVLRMFSEEISESDRLSGYTAAEVEALLRASKTLLPFCNSDCIEHLVQEVIKADRLQVFTEAHLVNIIESLSALRVCDKAAVSLLLDEITKRTRLPFFTQQNIATLISALKTLGFGSHPKMTMLLSYANPEELAQRMTDRQMIAFILDRQNPEAEDELQSKMLNRLLKPEKLSTLSDANLCQLMSGLGNWSSDAHDKIGHCVSEVIKRLQTATPQALSNYGYALCMRRIDSKDVLGVFVTEILRKKNLSQFEAFQLAGIMYTLGVLGWKNRAAYQALLQELFDRCTLEELSEKGLCHAVAAVQLSGIELDERVHNLLIEATYEHRLMHCTERSLLALVSSFGKMRLQKQTVTAPLMEEITKFGRLARLTNLDLVHVVYNLAQMRFKSARVMENIKKEVLKSTRLPKLTTTEFCMLVYGLGGLRVRDEELMYAIEDHIISSVYLPFLKNPEISNLVSGLGGLRCWHEACQTSVLTEATRVERLEALTASEFTSIVYGTGSLPDVDRQFVGPLLQALEKAGRLESLTEQQLTHVCMAMMHLIPPDRRLASLEELLNEVTKTSRLQSFTSYQLVSLAAVLTKSTSWKKYPAFPEALAAEVSKSKRLTSMTQSDLTQISRSFSEASFGTLPVVKYISDELVRRFTR